jgi:basic membrane protein A and related proteins
MTSFRSRALRLTIAAGALALTGAAAIGTGAATASSKAGPKAVLVSIQPVNDKGVMQDFVGGFNAGAKKYGYAAAKVVIVTSASDYIPTLQAVAGRYDLVITTFPPMIQAVDTVAPKFPKTQFVLLDAQTMKAHPNVQTLFFKENESSFLSGIVAGMMTKTDKVGFLGALVQDVINRYLVGFYEGVKYVNPKAKVSWAYVNALEDPALGKQFALQMYGKGIDIIHAATAGTEVGVYEASQQDKKFLIGADVDIRPLDPAYGLTASGPDFSGAAKIVMQQQAQGTFLAGRHQYGLKEGAVRILPFNTKLVPANVRAKVQAAQKLIVSGKLHVDTDTKLKQLKNGS